jgi:adenylate cyclase
MTLEQFAELAQVPAEDITEYRDAGLLDPDRDGLFDDYDVLRLRLILIRIADGEALDEIVRELKAGNTDFPFVQILFAGADRTYSLEEAAQATGFDPEEIRELWTAIGIPLAWIGETDIEHLRAIRRVMEAGFPWEAVLESTSVAGDGLRRFAESEVRLMHRYVHEPMSAAGMDSLEIARQTGPIVESIRPIIDALILYTHWAYVVRFAAEDTLSHLESDRGVTDAVSSAVVFVDLSSFTALANVMGDEEAAEVVGRFDRLVRPLVLEHGGTLVKQIGDAFMLAFRSPSKALDFSVALQEQAEREVLFPAISIGIHAGPVVYRMGDYIGNTVNIASRLATDAMPDEILITEAVAEQAPDGVEVEKVGVRLVRGISEPLPLFRVAKARRQIREDPVCGMRVGEDAAARLERNGRAVYFCSEECLRKFLDNPERYEAAALG